MRRSTATDVRTSVRRRRYLTNWTLQAYPGPFQANWQLATDGLSVLQTGNSAPSLFCSDFDGDGCILAGDVVFETSIDDDFIVRFRTLY